MFVVSWRLLFGLLAGTAALGARSLHISAAAARALSGGGLGLGLGLAPRAVAVAVMTLFAYDVQVSSHIITHHHSLTHDFFPLSFFFSSLETPTSPALF